MAKIMALEGPRPDRLAQLRGELYASMPRPWWRALNGLQGWFYPWRMSWPFALGMLAFGAWLGGSKRGRRIVAAARGR